MREIGTTVPAYTDAAPRAFESDFTGAAPGVLMLRLSEREIALRLPVRLSKRDH